MGTMVGESHVKDIEGDSFHWVCGLRTMDWLRMCHEHGHRFTCLQLFNYYMVLPTVIFGKNPERDKRKSQERLQEYVDVQINAKDWAFSEGIKEPHTREEFLIVIRKRASSWPQSAS
jgi:hypothetical protein